LVQSDCCRTGLNTTTGNVTRKSTYEWRIIAGTLGLILLTFTANLRAVCIDIYSKLEGFCIDIHSKLEGCLYRHSQQT
jgi:hypothetical protein